jgi:SAM-dependent methyltransferase
MSEQWRFRTVASLLADHAPANGRVLDVGAWPGIMTLVLKRLGWDVVALDKDVERSTSKTPSAGEAACSLRSLCEREGIESQSADIEAEPFPFRTSGFDAVVFTEIVEHLWADPLMPLRQIARVMKPGGILLVSTPNLVSLRNRLNFMRGRVDQMIESPVEAFRKREELGHMGHLRLYAPEELMALLREVGFVPILTAFQSPQDSPQNPEAARTRTASATVRPSMAKRVVKKFVRTPRSYWDAVLATAIVAMERRVPSFRSTMFVVARSE